MFNQKVKKDLHCGTHSCRVSHVCIQHDCYHFMKPLCKLCRPNHSSHLRRLLPLQDFLIQFRPFPKAQGKTSSHRPQDCTFQQLQAKIDDFLDKSLDLLEKTASATSLGRIRALSKLHKNITQSQSVVQLEEMLQAASYLLNVNQRGQFQFRGQHQKNHIQLRSSMKSVKQAIEQQGSRCQQYVQKVLDVLCGEHQYDQIQTLPVLTPTKTDFVVKHLSAHRVISALQYNPVVRPVISTQTDENDVEIELQSLREQLGKVRMHERERIKTIIKLQSQLQNNQFEGKHLSRKFREINVKNSQLINQNRTLSSENTELSALNSQLQDKLKLFFDQVIELPGQELAKTQIKFHQPREEPSSLAATHSKWIKQM